MSPGSQQGAAARERISKQDQRLIKTVELENMLEETFLLILRH
jgi:hypothetical protein